MNESLVKYLAGLMDADGSLSLTFKNYEKVQEDTFFLGLSLRIASSDAVDVGGFIDHLPETIGMGGVYRYGDKKQFKTWITNRRSELEMLLPRLIKHMVIKGRHWQWLLDTWREQRGARVSSSLREELAAASKRSRAENSGPVKPKNHPTWAWLAGYLDGDGWYRFKHLPRKNCCMLGVGAVAHDNDGAVLEFLCTAFGGKIYEHGQSQNVKVWHRNLGVKDASFALRFLPNLAKHSRLKRNKIDQMIAYHRQRLSVPSAVLAA